jgi:hypothetical protein
MAKTKLTDIVCLDTEVFDGNGLNLETTNLRILRKLSIAGSVSIVLTEINYREIQAHFRQRAKDIFDALKKVGKLAHSKVQFPSLPVEVFGSLNSAAIEDEAAKLFDEFCVEVNAKIILNNPNVLSLVIDRYFKQDPPFGNAKKKSEFPDAISLASLDTWAEHKATKVYVISRDPDLTSACPTFSNLHHLASVEDFLDIHNANEEAKNALGEALDEQEDVIFKQVSKVFERLGFIWRGDADGDVEDVRVVEVSNIQNLKILELDDDEALLQVDCDITFEADVSYDDLDSAWYDSEDKTLNPWRTEEETLEIQQSFSVTIQTSFEAEFKSVKVQVTEVNDGDDVEVERDDGYPYK